MAEHENISNPQFFEGVEKLLEIWFTPNPLNKNADLRKIPRTMWDALLKSVRCEIISFKRNEQIDAYVLSESSMFVSKRRWILKTCGTTTPLECIEPLLQMAESLSGYTNVDNLFYSRKNFKRPDLQVTPHRAFEEEVSLLDSFFGNGRAYCLGSINRDCWYLYTYNREEEIATLGCFSEIEGRNNSIESVNRTTTGIATQEQYDIENLLSLEPDQTIEILMTDLDPDVMAIFTKEECKNGTEATHRSGIEKLIPDMIIDDYSFEPCGYSMNGISKQELTGNEGEGCYMTIHVTPEPEFSFVSFESNVAASNYGDLISRVIKLFQPSKFLVTIFVSKTSKAIDAGHELDYKTTIGEWKRRDIQYCRFPGYDLTYAHYSKFPS